MEIIKSMFGKETGITESELRSLVGTEHAFYNFHSCKSYELFYYLCELKSPKKLPLFYVYNA